MAITFVQCTDTAHAVACAKVGILYLQVGTVGTGTEWVLNNLQNRGAAEIEFMHRTNRANMWPPSEFAYAVED